jgi:uncharacterized protein YxjI
MFERKTVVVKERVGFLKLTDIYDLLDPATGQPIGIAKEEPTTLVKYLRLLVNKALMPTAVNVYERETDPPVLSITRGMNFLRPKVTVSTREREIGYFQPKLFSFRPSFRIFDMQQQEIGYVKGDWKGWNFQLLTAAGQVLGRVTKKWGGLGKELFTSADTYVIDLDESATGRKEVAQLLLAAGLAIDTLYKESK